VNRDMRHRLERAVGPDRKWVIPQLILLALFVVAVPMHSRRHPRAGRGARTRLLGLSLLAAAAWIAARSKTDLSRSFTMSPTPVYDGELIAVGVYGVVRHPMYLSVLLSVLGYLAVWRSRLAMVSLGIATAFLSAKIRYEERELTKRYDTYEQYRDQVRWRFLPGIV
jgi:protein-S-isoprenylcysteine O-methyltransferase Ste14